TTTAMHTTATENFIALRYRSRGSGSSMYRHSQRHTTPIPYPAAKHAPESGPCTKYVRGMRLGVSEAAKKAVPNIRPPAERDLKNRRDISVNRQSYVENALTGMLRYNSVLVTGSDLEQSE